MRKILIALTLAGLAACGQDPGAGNLTAEENRELNEAAEMLDVPSDSLVADEDAPLGNGEADVAATGDVLVSNDAEARE